MLWKKRPPTSLSKETSSLYSPQISLSSSSIWSLSLLISSLIPTLSSSDFCSCSSKFFLCYSVSSSGSNNPVPGIPCMFNVFLSFSSSYSIFFWSMRHPRMLPYWIFMISLLVNFTNHLFSSILLGLCSFLRYERLARTYISAVQHLRISHSEDLQRIYLDELKLINNVDSRVRGLTYFQLVPSLWEFYLFKHFLLNDFIIYFFYPVRVLFIY